MVEPELPQSSGVTGGSDAAGDAGDFDAARRPGCDDFCAQRLHAGEGGGAVGASGEVGKARGAFSECAEHGVAMADGLVAGQAQAAEDVAGGADDAFLDGGGQDGLRGFRQSNEILTEADRG